MAYQIDFTVAYYDRRRWKKALLRLLLLAVIGGVVWGVNDVYTTYNQPTLNMKLAEYEAVAHPIEEMNAAWDTAAKDYAALVRYYRLVWAANPTNFLMASSSSNAPRLSGGIRPLNWTLTTGGDCRLDFRFAFDTGDKAEQVKGLEDEFARAVTSVVQVAGDKIDVKGVQHENLLNVEALSVSVGFSLPDVRAFPSKEKTLADCVSEIVAMRKKVQESKFADKIGVRGVTPTAQSLMMEYLPSQYGKDKETGKPNPDFPDLANVIDIAEWFKRADKFILRNHISCDEAKQRQLKEAWTDIGDAKLPWDRFGVLDNEALANRTKALQSVSDGVRRLKGFLEKRQADNQKKLEPFIEAYDHDDIFNKPLVESDLKDRVAAAAGLSRASVTFRDEPNAEPPVLVKDDEKFTFSLVRWTLSIGGAMGRDGESAQSQDKTGDEAPITLKALADCINRILTLGPGYVLEKMKVSFAADGNVSGALLEGLLPVKRVESIDKK